MGYCSFITPLPFIIAELGTSHNGDIAKAKEMVCAAKESGADCVKVQIVKADEILHPNTGTVPLPGGSVRLYDMFKKLEKPIEFYAQIKDFAESKKLEFLATPFGLESAAELKSLQPKIVKAASPELNYVQLLQELGTWNVPALLSSGVSKLSDIETALTFFDTDKIVLLHCITAYPAPEDQYNLLCLRSLSNVFGVQCGISDHSLDPVLVPVLSLACGGTVIEKHFCLSHNDPGLDDKIALDSKDFSTMTRHLHIASTKTEQNIIDELSYEYGREKVLKVLGNGVKKLAKAEEANYMRTNRSIHAVCDIKAGTVFTKENIAILRTEKILTPGIAPIFYESILGKTASCDLSAGQGVLF
ncbi:MAG: N-acetylneuraminate synthase family protein [Termitinemataceae bacterium]|nr:MAG: N-acetylneuraminate synthase family protein [Termitinemataceae bacterium]